MKKQDKKGILILSIIVILIITVITVSIVISKKDYSSKGTSVRQIQVTDEYKDVDTRSYRNEFIAAVYLKGIIDEKNLDYDQQWLMDTITSLKDNEKNVAIALYVDSPGGAVYQADEIYLALQDYKTTGKPVYVYQGPMSASGGYYISCAGDAIYANRNTLTGCIGVIFGQSIDITGLLDKVGVKSKTFHSGRNKTMLNLDEPLTKEQEEIMQSMCDEAYQQFVSIVANSRNMTYDQAEELSDGRLYSAKQALDNGLIDGINTWDEMLTILAEDILDKPGITVIDFKNENVLDFSIFDYLLSYLTKAETNATALKLGISPKIFELMQFDSYPAYLYREY